MNETINIFRPYLRGLPFIVMMMIGSYLVASKYLNYVTPMYESTTKVKLADISEGVSNSNLFKDLDVFATSNKVAGEIEILKSELLLDQTLDELDFDLEVYRKGKIRSVELYGDNPFNINLFDVAEAQYDHRVDFQFTAPDIINIFNDQGILASGKLNDTIMLPHVKVIFSLNEVTFEKNKDLKKYDMYSFKLLSRRSLISAIKETLDISAVDKDVAVVRIIYKSPSAMKASIFAAKLAQVYISDYIDAKYKVAHVTANFLQEQIESVNAKLSEAENSIQNYRDENGITNIRQETETELRRISQLKIQETSLKMSIGAMEELERYIKNGEENFLDLAPNFEAFTDVLSTEIVKNIKAYQAQKRDLLLIYTEEEETVQIIDKKIEDLTSYLIESISNTRKNLETKYNLLVNEIAASEKVFILVPAQEKMLAILNREFNIYEKSFNFLNEKKIEAEIAQAAKIAFHRIISPALVPLLPVSPNRTIIKIVSTLLGMFAAIVFIFIIHLLKARVNNRKTIEENSVVPLAVETPKLKSDSEIEKHFQRLVAQLEIKSLVKEQQLICISDFKINEGALFNGLHMALTLAKQGAKVLVVDVANTCQRKIEVQAAELIDAGRITVEQVDDRKFSQLSKNDAEDWLLSLTKGYTYTVVLNDHLGSRNSLLMCSFAELNLISLDARLTLATKVMDASLLVEEYQLKNVHFILNRAFYNPNIVHEVYMYLIKAISKISRARR
ncbi:MAG: hypothetical protein ACI9L9_000499 [Marivirga sp.]|jgi:uncharacterized protein involved in exopolysaccharide biosynthesis